MNKKESDEKKGLIKFFPIMCCKILKVLHAVFNQKIYFKGTELRIFNKLLLCAQ